MELLLIVNGEDSFKIGGKEGEIKILILILNTLSLSYLFRNLNGIVKQVVMEFIWSLWEIFGFQIKRKVLLIYRQYLKL